MYLVSVQVEGDGILLVSDAVWDHAPVRCVCNMFKSPRWKEKKRQRQTNAVSFLIYWRKDQFILLYSTFLIQYQAIKWNNSRRKTCFPSYFYDFMASLDAARARLICINRSALYWYLRLWNILKRLQAKKLVIYGIGKWFFFHLSVGHPVPHDKSSFFR